MVRAIKRGQSAQCAKKQLYSTPEHCPSYGGSCSVGSRKSRVELDSHADICVVGDNCLVIHNHNRPENVYSYDSKDGHRNANTVDATVGCQDPQSGQKFISMINQAI